MQIFDDSRLTKLINVAGSTLLCCQLWAEGGGAVWIQVKVPENGDTGLLMMPVRRRMRSRSRVDLPNGREQEGQTSGRERTWQSAVWLAAAPVTKAQEWAGPGYGPSKSMEVVLGGVTKEESKQRKRSWLL